MSPTAEWFEKTYGSRNARIHELYNKGFSATCIGVEFNISAQRVWQIVHNQRARQDDQIIDDLVVSQTERPSDELA